MIFVQYGSVEARAPEEPILFPAAVAAVRAASAVAVEHELNSVAIEFVPDERIRELNVRYRGVDAATDVLTFTDANGGDIAIGISTLCRQAALREISIEEEAGFLALHGALHLSGFDDESPDELRRMKSETERFASRLGLPGGDWHSIYHLQDSML